MSATTKVDPWAKLAGMVCTCPHWGDARTCDPSCRPCSIMRGAKYVRRSS